MFIRPNWPKLDQHYVHLGDSFRLAQTRRTILQIVQRRFTKSPYMVKTKTNPYILIADDEKPARGELRYMLEALGANAVYYEAVNGKKRTC